MALAHVQTIKTIGNGVTSVTSSSITTTAGNLLVFSSVSYRTEETFTPTDNKTNTWTQNPSSPQTSSDTLGQYAQQWHAANCLGGASHTFTLTGTDSGSYILFFITEVSGAALTSVLDTSAGARTSSTTTPSTGVTGTRSQAAEILIACVGDNNSGSNLTWTAGSGFTIPTNGKEESASNQQGAVEYQIVSSAGTDAGTFTVGTAKICAILIGTYKEAAAAGGRPEFLGSDFHIGGPAFRGSNL